MNSFESYLQNRYDTDTVEGFLIRLVQGKGGWMDSNPQSLREWLEERGFDEKVQICVDIAEVNWQQYLAWKGKQREIGERIDNSIARVK